MISASELTAGQHNRGQVSSTGLLGFLSCFARHAVNDIGGLRRVSVAVRSGFVEALRSIMVPMKLPAVTSSPLAALLICSATAVSVAGCDDGWAPPSQPDTTAGPPPPVPDEPATHGYFSGSIVADGGLYYSEALVTADGFIRVFVSQAPDAYDSANSRQFVGQLEFDAGQAAGLGNVYTQECEDGGAVSACGSVVSAAVSITIATRSMLAGAITILGEDEVWPFGMGWPTHTYLEPATLGFAAGQYEETLAKFARFAVINVDGGGRIFFQSSDSSCVGNGTLTPHSDGAFNVYDVVLLVENCRDGFESRNGRFEGLATRTFDDWGEWGDWLVLWLSTPEGTPVPQAFVMWGRRL